MDKNIVNEIEKLFDGSDFSAQGVTNCMNSLSTAVEEMSFYLATQTLVDKRYFLDIGIGYIGHSEKEDVITLNIYDPHGKLQIDGKRSWNYECGTTEQQLEFLFNFLTYYNYGLKLYPYEEIIRDINCIINNCVFQREELREKFGLTFEKESCKEYNKECYLNVDSFDVIGKRNSDCDSCELYPDCYINMRRNN